MQSEVGRTVLLMCMHVHTHKQKHTICKYHNLQISKYTDMGKVLNDVLLESKASSWKNLFIVTILSLMLISNLSSILSLPSSHFLAPGTKVIVESVCWIHFPAACVFLLVPFSSTHEHIYLLLIKSAGMSLQAYVHWKKFKWLWP